jgi:hypothetical protein
MTSLTAHPYVVLAEQQWKQEQLGGANLAPRRNRGRHGSRWHLPRRSRRTARAMPRPV